MYNVLIHWFYQHVLELYPSPWLVFVNMVSSGVLVPPHPQYPCPKCSSAQALQAGHCPFQWVSHQRMRENWLPLPTAWWVWGCPLWRHGALSNHGDSCQGLMAPSPASGTFLTDKNSASQGCRFEGYSWESELPSTSQESLSGSQPCNVLLLGSSRTFLGDFLVPSLFHSLETHIRSWNSSVAVWFVCPLIHQDLGLLRLCVLKASFSVFCQVLEIFLMGG